MPLDGSNYTGDDTILKNLIGARALIADEGNWVAGMLRHITAAGVIQFCALGALNQVRNGWALSFGHVGAAEVDYLFRFAETSVTPEFYKLNKAAVVASHNNVLGHAATLEMFDGAIAARRADVMEMAYAV